MVTLPHRSERRAKSTTAMPCRDRPVDRRAASPDPPAESAVRNVREWSFDCTVELMCGNFLYLTYTTWFCGVFLLNIIFMFFF